jgi:hypothetical protein
MKQIHRKDCVKGYGWEVKELNMEKLHTGFWRKTPSLNVPAYDELGLTSEMIKE